MQDTRETADNKTPAAYELGKMFYRAGREYNPYQPDTEAYTDFLRGKLDAEDEAELYAEIVSWDYADLERRLLALSATSNKPSL